jgi:hypothetical protein
MLREHFFTLRFVTSCRHHHFQEPTPSKASSTVAESFRLSSYIFNIRIQYVFMYHNWPGSFFFPLGWDKVLWFSSAFRDRSLSDFSLGSPGFIKNGVQVIGVMKLRSEEKWAFLPQTVITSRWIAFFQFCYVRSHRISQILLTDIFFG